MWTTLLNEDCEYREGKQGKLVFNLQLIKKIFHYWELNNSKFDITIRFDPEYTTNQSKLKYLNFIWFTSNLTVWCNGIIGSG